MTARRDDPARSGDQVAGLAAFDFFLIAGLVALNVFAAALRAAGVFAVFIVFAAALFVSGAAACAGAAFGAAAFFAGALAGAAATFLAGAFAAFGAAAGFAVFGAAVFGAAFAGAFAVLAAARTAMACARGRLVVLSSLIMKAFSNRVADAHRGVRRSAGYVARIVGVPTAMTSRGRWAHVNDNQHSL